MGFPDNIKFNLKQHLNLIQYQSAMWEFVTNGWIKVMYWKWKEKQREEGDETGGESADLYILKQLQPSVAKSFW